MNEKDFMFDQGLDTNEEVISKLKFIGCIQKEEKIDVRRVGIQPNTLLTSLYRTFFYKDNRINSLKFVKDVIIRSFQIIELQHKNTLICKSIISDIKNAVRGIINLKQTYIDDIKFKCDMEVVIERIRSDLEVLKEKYPELFEEDKVEKKEEGVE